MANPSANVTFPAPGAPGAMGFGAGRGEKPSEALTGRATPEPAQRRRAISAEERRSVTRPSPSRTPADVIGIWGLCPKCDGWFACDDFFDRTVALPCCPSCHLAPVTLDYLFPQAGATAAGAGQAKPRVAPAKVEISEPVRRSRGHGETVMVAGTAARDEQGPLLLTRSQAVSFAHEAVEAPPLGGGIAGVDLGVAAHPADPAFSGDTHGAFASPDGEWTLLLADIAGQGNDAAAQTAVVRNSVRRLATAVKGPGMMLALLNQLLITDPTVDRLCSAVTVRLHTASPGETGLRATVGRAGHPCVPRSGGRAIPTR